MVKLRVTYTIGTDTQPIPEVVEATNEGSAGALAALQRIYPNRQIHIISCHRA